MSKSSIKSAFAAVAAMTIAASLGGPAHANDVRDFQINNLTQRTTVDGAWIAPAIPNTPWERIELSSPIGPQSNRAITLSGWNSNCHFDVKVSLDNGNMLSYDNVNLCRVLKLNVE